MAGEFRTPFTPREQSDALVVHCSDPRFQKYFHDFLRGRLGLDTYGLLAVPGGAQLLTLVDYLPKFSWAGWRWMKFLVDLSRPRRLVLIAHDDCRWYKDVRFWRHSGDWKGAALSDLGRVRDGFHERFGEISVEAYFARIEGAEVVFEAVKL